MGRDLVHFIGNNFYLLKFYRNEDASLATWIAGLDVKVVHDVRFDTEWESRGCSNEYLVTHKKSPQELEAIYNLVRYQGILCKKEFVHRQAYEYDFSVIPSKCCLDPEQKQKQARRTKSRAKKVSSSQKCDQNAISCILKFFEV